MAVVVAGGSSSSSSSSSAPTRTPVFSVASSGRKETSGVLQLLSTVWESGVSAGGGEATLGGGVLGALVVRSSPDHGVSSVPLARAAWLQLSALDFFSEPGPPLAVLLPPLRIFFRVFDGLVFPLVSLAFLAPTLALVILGLALPGATLATSAGARSSGLRNGERLSRSLLNLTSMEPRPEDRNP